MPNTQTVDLKGLSVQELMELNAKIAQQLKTRRTPTPTVSGYVDSVEKHVKSTLVAAHKLLEAEGVPPAKMKRVEDLLARLAPDRWRDEAKKVPIPARRRAKLAHERKAA